MKFDPPLIEARLLRRYKRFLADVQLLSGEHITVHCPNTGRMTGCIEEGARVWLSLSSNPRRKYPYTWELVEIDGTMIAIHSAQANQLFAEALDEQRLPEFQDYPQVCREVQPAGGSSRLDFALYGDAGSCYVEIKSVTLCRADGFGCFPDAPSQRAVRHLDELCTLLANDVRCVLVYIVQHSAIKRVGVAGDIDPLYASAVQRCIDAGVEILAYGVDVSPQRLSLQRRLAFSAA